MSKPALVVSRKDINTISKDIPLLNYITDSKDIIANIDSDVFFNQTFTIADRGECENNPELLQIIPYITIMDKETKRLLRYRRGKAGNEDRLHDLYSIGLGGHIDELPQDDESVKDLIVREACRELCEEIGIVITDDIKKAIYNQLAKKVRLIYTEHGKEEKNYVNMVHLGIAIVVEIDFKNDLKYENCVITDPSFESLTELSTAVFANHITLERWSYIILYTWAKLACQMKDLVVKAQKENNMVSKETIE